MWPFCSEKKSLLLFSFDSHVGLCKPFRIVSFLSVAVDDSIAGRRDGTVAWGSRTLWFVSYLQLQHTVTAVGTSAHSRREIFLRVLCGRGKWVYLSRPDIAASSTARRSPAFIYYRFLFLYHPRWLIKIFNSRWSQSILVSWITQKFRNWFWLNFAEGLAVAQEKILRFWRRSGFFCEFWVYYYCKIIQMKRYGALIETPLRSPGGSAILGGGLRAVVASSLKSPFDCLPCPSVIVVAANGCLCRVLSWRAGEWWWDH